MAIITNAALCVAKLKAEELWADGMLKSQFTVNAEAARAIVTEQTAMITPITGNPEKDNTVEVSWIDPCAIAAQACPADWCDVTAAPITTVKATYALNLCRMVPFSVDETDIAGSIYSKEEVIAKGEIVAKAKLDEYLSAQGLIFLNANAGTNLYPAPYAYNAGTKSTDIAVADYNRKIVPYFETMAMLHEIENPYYIDNGTLYIDWRNAELDANNLNGQGDAARRAALRLYFDMKGFVAAGVTPDDTFMVGKNSVALGNRYYNPDTPTEMSFRNGTQTRYNVMSNNLPGVHYDVIYQMSCVGKRVLHTWNYIVTAGYFLNPTACVATTTGIMSFTAI